MQRLLGAIRRADEQYGLIAAGDRIALGVSGGKDSLALLMLLSAYRRFSPRPFALHAFTLTLTAAFDTAPIQALCREMEVPFTVENMDILPALEKEKNPCALCARLRRGYLCRMAKAADCNVLALGHHREDDLETYLMSGLAEGRFYQLQPKSRMEDAGVTLIRPLLDVKETALADLCRRYQLPVMKNPCPVDGKTNRAETKALLFALEQKRPGALDQLSRALARQRKEASP
ncbi:MAG: tRNA 2-thiocytidine(32) synthetase TtcA [Clostridiales bacterium]|nr:tRNA 2-thiocytidine(32) synthetase TtcA [Clostridiales bacterium]